MLSSSLALLLLSQLALGAVTPTAPGPDEVFTAGSDCPVSWVPDESGKWKSFSIDLMSGSNSNMTLVANVVEDLDGTDPSLSPFAWHCPDVDPYSTIYFYQFTPSVAAADESNPAWTTRFTITSPAGETTDPDHGEQPNGDSVPWGIGVLRFGPSVASRKNHGSNSTVEEDSDEDYSTDEGRGTGQRSSSGKPKGGTEYDEGVSSTGTSASKGSSGSSGMSIEDSEDSEVSEDDETSSRMKSGSSKSALKDTEEDSGATDTKTSGNEGSSSSLTNAEDEEPGLESMVSTSSRLKTIHSKPTSTPFPTGGINAATPTIPLPDTPLSSAQPVGCAGGTNASSTYCSAPASTNYATHGSKLDSRTLFATVLILSFGLL